MKYRQQGEESAGRCEVSFHCETLGSMCGRYRMLTHSAAQNENEACGFYGNGPLPRLHAREPDKNASDFLHLRFPSQQSIGNRDVQNGRFCSLVKSVDSVNSSVGSETSAGTIIASRVFSPE